MSDAKTITQALAAAKAKIGAVGKEQRNTQQNFNFRGIDDVVNAAAPHLNDEGIVIFPEIVDYTYETVEVGRNKTPMAHVVGKVRYWFYGPLGDARTALVLSESMDAGDKGVAKMMSVAYRIALLQVLNLPTMDRDPDLDSYERSGSGDSISAVMRKAQDAENIETVREAYKEAGRSGVLKCETAHPVTGEKITLEEYLQKRGDELNGPETSKSTESAKGNSRRNPGNR